MIKRIITSSDILFGKPRIKGTRISVDQILSCLAEGQTFQEILKEFPDVTKEDIQACVSYANQLVLNIHVINVKPKNAKISH